VSRLPRFAGDRLRQRRLELGIAETALASTLAVTPMVVRLIEAGGSANHDLRFLARYAAALGLEVLDLFDAAQSTPDSAPTRRPDAERLGAALVASGGTLNVDAAAEELGWSPERTRLAADSLEAAVRSAGMRLVWHGGADVFLAPADGETPTVAAVGARSIGTYGLTRAEAEVLVGVLDAGSRIHRSGAPAVVLSWLTSSGVIRNDRTGPVGQRNLRRVEIAASARTLYDLYLTDEPPDGAGPPGSVDPDLDVQAVKLTCEA